MENKYYIYFHINPLTNEVFYVGKGQGRRAWEKFGRNNYWTNTVNKYGYKVDIIHENLSEKRAFDWEKLYISMFGKENLTNMTDGGEGSSGVIPNEQTRKKMSDAHKGCQVWNKGKNLSEEHKQKLKGKTPYFKGKTHTDEIKKLIGEKTRNRLKGIKQNDEFIIKRTKNLKGKKRTDEQKKYIASKMGKKCEYNGEVFNKKKDVWLKYFSDIPYGTFTWKVSTNRLQIIEL